MAFTTKEIAELPEVKAGKVLCLKSVGYRVEQNEKGAITAAVEIFEFITDINEIF